MKHITLLVSFLFLTTCVQAQGGKLVQGGKLIYGAFEADAAKATVSGSAKLRRQLAGDSWRGAGNRDMRT